MKSRYLSLLIIFVFLLQLCNCRESIYSKKEMSTLPCEIIMNVDGKTFYFISDARIGGFIKKGQVFTHDNNVYTVYLTINGGVIRNKDGSVIFDSKNYAGNFFAWKLEKKPSETGFWLFLCEDEKTVSDPISMSYISSEDLISEKELDMKH